MKKKTISIVVKEEDYNRILKLAIDDALKENKRPNISAYTWKLIERQLNGNKPSKTPAKEVSKEPSFDDIQVDF